MKNRFAIFILLFILLIPFQPLFAQGYIKGSIGINTFGGSFNDFYPAENAAFLSALPNYGLTISGGLFGKLSLFADISGISNSSYVKDEANLFKLNLVSVYLRYDILNFNKGNVGIQLGILYNSFKKIEYYNSDFYLAGGIFADLYINPKMWVYMDLKMPLFYKAFYKTNYEWQSEDIMLVKHFLYDLELGINYEIVSSIFLGVSGRINTMSNDYDLESYSKENATKLFSIKCSLGYKF